MLYHNEIILLALSNSMRILCGPEIQVQYEKKAYGSIFDPACSEETIEFLNSESIEKFVSDADETPRVDVYVYSV